MKKPFSIILIISICLMNVHLHGHEDNFGDNHSHHSDTINSFENCSFCNLNNDNIFNEFSLLNDFNNFEILFFSNPFNSYLFNEYLFLHNKSPPKKRIS